MPTYETKTSKVLTSGKFKVNQMVDTDKLIDYFKGCSEAHIYVEKVHSVFGSSASSNFSFGYNVGAIHATIRALRMGFNLIPPKDWQKLVIIESDIVMKDEKKRDTKKTAANAAARIFPDVDFRRTPRSKIAHDGMVDAALIAYAGYLIERSKK